MLDRGMGTINQERVSYFIEIFEAIAQACWFLLRDVLNAHKSYEMVFLHKQFNMPNGILVRITMLPPSI